MSDGELPDQFTFCDLEALVSQGEVERGFFSCRRIWYVRTFTDFLRIGEPNNNRCTRC